MNGVLATIRDTHLSKCAADYARAMANPSEVDEACLPVANMVETKKSKVFIRGDMQVSSTNGIGWIVVAPERLASNNQNYSVLTTLVTYTGTSVPGTTPTGVVQLYSNAEYANADFGTGQGSVRYRLVTCEITVKDATVVLQRGGNVLGLIEPDHQSLENYTLPQLLGYDSCWRESGQAGSRTYSLKWNGVRDPADADFKGGFGSAEHSMVIGFNGAPSAIYQFEVVAHFEYIGTPARGKTATWADPQGQAVVQTAMGIANNSQESSHDSAAWYARYCRALKQAAHMMLPTLKMVAPTVARVGVGYAFGGPAGAARAVMPAPTKAIKPKKDPKKAKAK